MTDEVILKGRYRLESIQATGGMAVVYRGIDEALGRTVAVKVLRRSLGADESFVARFINEARSIANLTHPNIVTVHDVGSEPSPQGDTHYIVMELVDGSDLKAIIRDQQGPLPVELALHYAIQICAGIGFAHRAGIVHADIKPQNILVTRDRIVKVTDFGIAQIIADTQPNLPQRERVVWGSPHYFAPEQARGERPTTAADVYSIGIVMFEMLTGQLPFLGTNQQELAKAHIREAIPNVQSINGAVPEDLARIVYKTMSKEPSGRWRMADQLGHILINYRDKGRERTVSAPAVGPQRPSTLPGTQSGPPAAPPMHPESQTDVVPPSAPANLPPSAAPPTQRMSAAPHAPSSQQQRPPVGPMRPLHEDYAVRIPSAEPGQQNTPLPQAPVYPGYSRPYVPDPRFADEDSPRLLDGPTIVLAVLAFVAVTCLIPLFISVWQSYNF